MINLYNINVFRKLISSDKIHIYYPKFEWIKILKLNMSVLLKLLLW